MSAEAAAIAADIGGTNLRVALVSPTGALLRVHREALRERSPRAVVAALGQAIATLGADPRRLPLGVAIAAMLRQDGWVQVAPNLGWREVDLRGLLEVEIGAEVTLLNDLDAALLGEVRAGAGQGCSEVALVLVGSGVGGALMSGGHLIRGAAGVAGEIGHVKVRPGGRPCGCGGQGCLEAYAGGHGLAARAREALAEGRAPGLARLVETPADVDARLVVRAAEAGDEACVVLLDQAADHLGLALANLATVLGCGRLLLGGSVLRGAPGFFERAARVIRREVVAPVGATLEVLPSALTDDAGLVGAALFAMER